GCCRPAGERLGAVGGRAPPPDPLPDPRRAVGGSQRRGGTGRRARARSYCTRDSGAGGCRGGAGAGRGQQTSGRPSSVERGQAPEQGQGSAGEGQGEGG